MGCLVPSKFELRPIEDTFLGQTIVFSRTSLDSYRSFPIVRVTISAPVKFRSLTLVTRFLSRSSEFSLK